MVNFNKSSIYTFVMVLVLSLLTSSLSAQDDLYESKTVWRVTTIKIDANMEDKYLKGLTKTWKATMEEAKKQGLILSYKVLLGEAANPHDYNLMLLVESKGFSDFDPNPEREAKWDAIQDKVVADLTAEGFDETIQMYSQIREMMGTKTLREIELH